MAGKGTTYLIHLDQPLGHARHYLGWAKNLKRRLDHHAAGTGARMLAVCIERGITWQLARTWPDTTRAREAQLKKQGGRARMCPLCGVVPSERLDPRRAA